MIRELRYSCPLPNGMHARPASLLAETVRRYRSRVTVINEDSGGTAPAESVLSVIGLDIKRGSPVLVRAEGEDAADALAALDTLFAGHFGESIAEGAAGETASATVAITACIPRALRNRGVRALPGRAVSRGVGMGQVVHVRAAKIPDAVLNARGVSPEVEGRAVDRAVAVVRAELEGRVRAARTEVEAGVAKAHLAIVEDDALQARIRQHTALGIGAPGAVARAAAHFADQLRACTSAYVRDRVDDIDEIAGRLIAHLIPNTGTAQPPIPVLTAPSVVVAESLTVGQLTAMDAKHLRALVLGRVGATSHTVILARSMEIPTLVGVEGVAALVEGREVIADAGRGGGGFVVAEPNDEVHSYYQRERDARTRRTARFEPIVRRPGRTADEVLLDVAANAASPGEVSVALSAHADGIGLLRTELLFLDRATAPTEDEQFEVYRRAVANARGKEVIIRTLDIGGDKPAPYLHLPHEENPFLGCRGVRLYHRFPALITAQLRAICRASAHGKVKVMAPMIATVEEAKWFVERVHAVQADLKRDDVPFDTRMPIGIMLEVPAACLIVDQLSKYVDFFSVGTNDLCQYTMAVDRGNTEVSALHDVRTPAFLRLLDRAVSAARRNDTWIGVCGEMAGDPLNLPLLVGLGVDEISVPASEIAEIKAALSGLEARLCRDLLDEALSRESAAEVRTLLEQRIAAGSLGQSAEERAEPIVIETIVTDSHATTKEEVIHELACALAAAGRTDDPRAIEEAVWKREDTYATSLGFGFAIPHGRTDAVTCASIAVARLRQPVVWSSGKTESGRADSGETPEQDAGVRGAFMLVVRATDTDQSHMKMLAKLARKLMHEEFRERVLGTDDAAAVLAYLRSELDLSTHRPA